jgi:hypothetical protein
MLGRDYAGEMVRTRQAKSAILAVLGVWVAIVLGNILFWGGLIYAAVHFARKYW